MIGLPSLLLSALLSLVDSKGSGPFLGNPYRYNLYKSGAGPHHSQGKPMSRHKNYCAYVVQKNISCVLQDGVATYVQAEYPKCIWGSKCPVVMYRTFYKPKYKVGYKTVTELEWRCCPGYSGDGCFEGPTSLPDILMPPFNGGLPHPAVKGYPRGHPRPHEPKPVPGGSLEPGRPFPGGQKPIPTGHLPTNTKSNYGLKFGVTGERLDRMEADLKRMTQGLDSLTGVVAGLEERLRHSLREDTNKMLGSLLHTLPRLADTSVGFGVIPDGLGGGGGGGFPGFGELSGRVTEVKDELRVKSDMLDEIHGKVLGHEGQLKRLLDPAEGSPVPGPSQKLLEELLDARLAGLKAEILDVLEHRLVGVEGHCSERVVQVQQQCHDEHMSGQQQMQQSLDGSETGLRKELGNIQAQIQGLTLTESCCSQVVTLSQRVLLLEESVKDLTESQRQLQLALGDHTVHVEARFEEVEVRFNTTELGSAGPQDELDGIRVLLEEKLKTLEERVLEELSNVTAPALLEGQVVPALETEIQTVRRTMEAKLDGVHKQLSNLELLCASSCSPGASGDVRVDEEWRGEGGGVSGRLDAQEEKLERLNGTLRGLLSRIAEEQDGASLQGEITLLKININSVNRTLKGLRDSVSLFSHEAGGHGNGTQQREEQLEARLHDITQLVGRQASLLGSGERRLLQLKGELQGLRLRLAGELRGCQSLALGAQREVMAVDERVAQVEGQCGGLGDLAQDLERIREELERHSESYLSQVDGTLARHSHQLAELKEQIRNCAGRGSVAARPGDQ